MARTYRYQALDSQGRPVCGRRSGRDAVEVKLSLEASGYRRVRVRQVFTPVALWQWLCTACMGAGRPVGGRELALWLRSLHHLLHTHHAFEAADTLVRHSPHPVLRRAAAAMAARAREGEPMMPALEQFPRAFSSALRRDLAAAEAAGRLEEACLGAAERYERLYLSSLGRSPGKDA